MTTTTRQAPHHRNLTCVKDYRCQRPECLARNRDYMNRRYRLMAYGRWQPYTDAEPVRRHVRMLMSYGIGLPRIEKLSGTSSGTMAKLMYAQHTRGRGPSKRVRAHTAARLLAVKPVFDNIAPRSLVDGTGTRRRLQALVAIGWPQMTLARLAGVDKLTVNDQVLERVPTAYGATARAVRDLYDQLWNVDPETRGVTRRWSEHARALAARRRWAPPAAWDDDTIDSPAATPDLGEHVGRYVSIAEDAHWLIDEHGYTRQQVAMRLGVTKRHLERAFAAERRQADTEEAAA